MDALPPLTRRAVLRGGIVVGVALLVPLGGAGPVVGIEVGSTPRFLTETELRTLRAVVDRFVPGAPEDVDDGAVTAGCAEAIDALLGAFRADPPRVYAGAPFSDRGGHPTNDFLSFLPLDPYEELAWRVRVEGSAGRADLERNGPVVGFQAVYRQGLAALDAAAGGDFAALPGPARDLLLRSGDPAVQALVDIAFPHTLDLLYGAPEYEGNRELLAWRYTGFEGDVLPRGWTREQIEHPEPGPASPLPVAAGDVAALASFGTHEAGTTVLMHGGGTAAGTARVVAQLLAGASAAAAERDAAAAAVRAVAAQIGSVDHGG
ncbi:MAG TPA: gluconate 2-dehydrogenase subunit 3 family protein [Mycobacteriales bacterium]|nr:gluconate 2-dehydrogenase subunit 3 family protein [Mycobacteriales bacterium]